MTLILLIAGSFAGGLFFGLLAGGLYALSRRRRRRSLALALTGEIAGILRLIETGGWESYLREAVKKSKPGKTCSFFVPKPVIFEAYARSLNLLGPSVAREIAQFHALLGGITGNASTVATDAKKAAGVLVQLEEALSLADDILRHLKPMLRRGRIFGRSAGSNRGL